MFWLTWHRHRWLFALAALILVALFIYYIQAGFTLYSDYSLYILPKCSMFDLTQCQPITTNIKPGGFPLSTDEQQTLNYTQLLMVLPLLIGVFIGAPLLASEQRTASLLRTQGVSLRRWLGTKLGLVYLATLLFSLLVTLLIAWWIRPLLASGSFSPWGFYRVTGGLLVAQSLFAVVIGTAVGAWLRSTLPAMVVTFFIMLVILLGAALYYPYLLPTSQNAYSNPNFNVSMSGGLFIYGGYANQDGQYVSDTNKIYAYCGVHIGPDGSIPTAKMDKCFAEKHLYYQTIYQPAQNYWPLQTVESTILIVFSLLGLPLIYWLTRKRLI